MEDLSRLKRLDSLYLRALVPVRLGWKKGLRTMIPRLAVSTFAMATVATLALANLGLAQGPGGGGLPNTPPTPPQNPITPAKTNLGLRAM